MLPPLLILATTVLFRTLVVALPNSDPAGLIILAAIFLCALLFAFLSIFTAVALFCALFVAIPARRLERSGIFTSVARSFHLTRGHRYEIFGILVGLVLGACSATTSASAAAGAAIKWIATLPFRDLVPLVNSAAPPLVLLLAFSVICLTWGFAHAIAYIDLRAAAEGRQPDFPPSRVRAAQPADTLPDPGTQPP